MPAFLAPYLPLIYVALAVGLFGSGVSVGHQWTEGVYAKAAAEALKGAVETARRDVEAESAASLAVAKANAARRAAATAKAHKLELEIARDETARTCRVSDSTFRVLTDSIDAANGAPPKTIRGDGSKPAVPEAGKSDSGGPVEVVTGWFRSIRGLFGGQESADRVD